jgi:hypothetical protein
VKHFALISAAIALSGCVTNVVSLSQEESQRYAVIEENLEAWLGSNGQGEFGFVSYIDGVWEEKYEKKKAGRTRPDGPLIKYVFIEPGTRDLVLNYNRNQLGPMGRTIWGAGVSERIVLKPGVYRVRYEVEGLYVTIWLEDSSGAAVTEKRRSIVGETKPKIPLVIPIPIK